jgi:hypothetical protein
MGLTAGTSYISHVVQRVRTRFKPALGWVATWRSAGLRWALRTRQGILTTGEYEVSWGRRCWVQQL